MGEYENLQKNMLAWGSSFQNHNKAITNLQIKIEIENRFPTRTHKANLKRWNEKITYHKKEAQYASGRVDECKERLWEARPV